MYFSLKAQKEVEGRREVGQKAWATLVNQTVTTGTAPDYSAIKLASPHHEVLTAEELLEVFEADCRLATAYQHELKNLQHSREYAKKTRNPLAIADDLVLAEEKAAKLKAELLDAERWHDSVDIVTGRLNQMSQERPDLLSPAPRR